MATLQELTTENGWKEEASKLVLQPDPSFTGSADLSSLARNSRLDQETLVKAALEEKLQREAATGPIKAKHHRLRSHGRPEIDTAAVATKILEEGGFEAFAERMTELFRQYHLERPELVVEYRDLSVTTKALVGSAGVATVGNVLPRVVKDLLGFGNETVDLHVLKRLKGRLDPGRFTLLLGPPGSGKSTFLRVISGRLKTAKNLKVGGSLLYNGKQQSEFVVERTAAYVDQYDKHIPVFTVGETLSFAHTCAVGHSIADFWKQALASHPSGAAGVAGAKGDGPEASMGSLRGSLAPVSVSSPDGQPGLDMDADGFVKPPEDAQQSSLDELAALMAAGARKQLKVELLLRLMGLVHTRNTIVGNALLRGVSGGERKRVTSAEMLVGQQRMLAMDEISTGLDSATLFSIVSFLKQATQSFRLTTVISLLQPPPEVFNLFDDLILMAEGSIVYHGPINGVQSFFEGLGFVLPARMDLPSWLQEVTLASGQWKYATDALKRRAGTPRPGVTPQLSAAPSAAAAAGSTARPVAEAAEGPAASAFAGAAATADEGPVPEPVYDPETGRLPWLVSIEQMVATYWSTTHGRKTAHQLDKEPFDPAKGSPRALTTQRYALSAMESIAVAFRRQWLLFIRNKALVIFRFVQIIVIGLIIGSMFARLTPGLNTVRLFFGASFLSLLFIAFGSAPELSLVLQNRPVWYKYRDNYFLPTYAEVVAMANVRAVNTAWECLIFGTLVYWMIGYTPLPGPFFTYLLLNFLIGLVMSALFRFIAAAVPTQTHAQAYGAMGILILVLTSGFAITRTGIPPWWIWAYYLSPFAYCLRGIVINEMSQDRWAIPLPTGQTVGHAGLESFGFFTDRIWIWIGVAYLIGFYILMNLLTLVALKYYSGTQRRASVPDDRALARARMEADERRARHLQHTQRANTAGSVTRSSSLLGRRRSSQELAVVNNSGGHAVVPVAPVIASATSTQLPFEPVTLVFKDLRYFVPNPAASSAGKKAAKDRDSKAAAGDAAVSKELELLKGITGFAQPGVLMALMGGSGAGKTTLMDVIAGRKTIGRITGDIFVNGHPKDQKTWSRVMGYVEQMDIHTPATTVLEALLFSASLRLPDTVSKQQMRTYVDEVVDIVDLLEIQNSLVGVPGESGLSTEQRKRLTIAVEMVANPAVIFMDEPTSGLDARAAAIVMTAVKNVALSNRTVFVTIHQPSINIFEAFDYLMLLQRGGRTTYFGPLGTHSRDLIHYLQSVPGTEPIQPGYNPATWMLEVTGGSMATIAAANNVDWPQLYLQSDLHAVTVAKAEKLIQRASSSPLQVSGKHRGYAQPFTTQLVECTKKLSAAYWRMPYYNFMRLVLTVGCALIYGSLYYKAGHITSNPATVANVQNIIGVLFSSTSFLGNINLMSVMPVFNTERVVFYRERAARMYDPFATGLATAAAEAPYLLAQTALFVPIVYFMVGFQVDAAKFWYYFLMAFLSIDFYTCFGVFLVSATPALEVATIFSSAINFMFNIFNGFTITYEQMPRGWQWANRITPTTWVLYGLGVSQLGDNNTPLVTVGSTVPTTTISGYLANTFGYYSSMQYWCLLILVGYNLFFRVGGILFLRYVNFLRR